MVVLFYQQQVQIMQQQARSAPLKLFDIKLVDIQQAINIQSATELQKIKISFKSDESDVVRIQCFSPIFEECIRLYKFRQVIKEYVYIRDKQGEFSSILEMQDHLKQKLKNFEEGKNNLSKFDKQLFEKLEQINKNERKIIYKVASILQKDDYQENQLKQIIEDSGVLFSPLQTIVSQIYENRSLKKALDLHKKQRQQLISKKNSEVESLNKQNQKNAKNYKHLLEMQHQYLNQYANLANLCSINQNQMKFEKLNQVIDCKYYYQTIHNFITSKSSPKIQDIMIKKLRQFLTQVRAPLKEDPNSQENDFCYIIDSQKDVMNEMERLIAVHKQFFAERERKIKEMEVQLTRQKQDLLKKQILEQQFNELKKIYDKAREEDAKNFKKNKELQNQIHNHQKNLNILKQNLMQQQRENQKINSELNQRQDKNQKLSEKNKQLSLENQKISEINQRLNEEIQKNKKETEQLKAQLVEKDDAGKRKIEQLKGRLNETQEQIAKKIAIIQQLQTKRQLQQKQNAHKLPIIRSKPFPVAQVSPSKLFSKLSPILRDQSLLYCLDQELHQKRNFQYAQLLYRYDPRNKSNIHDYIDNKPNILFVAKTSKRVVGAFCSSPFKPKEKGINSDSFLFTYKQGIMTTFPLVEGKGAFEHDKNFLIFGKSDLRVEIGSLNLSSNFGFECSHFKGNGAKVNDLLEQGSKRDVRMVTYEVFQLIGENVQSKEDYEKEIQEDQAYRDSTAIMVEELIKDKQMEQLKKQIILLSKEIKAAEIDIQQQKMKHDRIVAKLKNQHDQNAQNLNLTIERLRINVNQLETSLKVSQTKAIQLSQENSQLLGKIRAQQEKVKKLQVQLKAAKQANQNLLKDDKLQILNKKITVLEQQIQQHQQNERTISKQTLQISFLQTNVKELATEKDQLISTLKDCREKLEEVTIQLNVAHSKNENLSIEIQELGRKNYQLSRDHKGLLEQNESLSRRLLSLEQRLRETRDFNVFFPNQVLDRQSIDKQFFIETLQDHQKRTVRWTKLLYRFDRLNRINFHPYIDNIPNIILLLRLGNGRVIGCYSNCAFAPGSKGQEALLMVAGVKRVYGLKRGGQAIAYDQYYLLFGNSEIRLKSGQAMVFSNFGIANGHFENNKETVDSLFGEGKEKQLPLAGYEIYQLVFE